MPSEDELLARLTGRLAAHDQEHVLRFWPELTAEQRRQLAAQVESVDLSLVARMYAQRDATTDYGALAARATEPPAFRLRDKRPVISREAALAAGIAALRNGTVGAILVAGGQGSRLGFDHPKGMFPIGPVSGHSLFQILFEKLLATRRRYGASIPLYIMTSAATHDETSSYLAEHDYFGLSPRDVTLFQQGNFPAVDAATGKLLLEARDSLALSPDGHGGMLAALATGGSLDDMRRRGLEQLFYFQVDNPLVVMCDPAFIGYHTLAGSELSTQVVAKTDPLERVGNVALVDGTLRIIEYSDLSKATARATNPNGSLKLWAGNTAIHVFDRVLLERMAALPDSLPFHIARKSVPYIDEQGRTVSSDEKNAIKFERFIFDLLPNAERGIVMEVDAREAFAPVKNADGEPKDTPSAARAQIVALHRRWLEEAGVAVADGVNVEVRPLFALDPQELAAKLKPPLEIVADKFFSDD